MASYYTVGADPNRTRTNYPREDENYYYQWSSTGELKRKTPKTSLQKYEEFLKDKWGNGIKFATWKDSHGGLIRITPATDWENHLGMGALNPYGAESSSQCNGCKGNGRLFHPNPDMLIDGRHFRSVQEIIHYYEEKYRYIERIAQPQSTILVSEDKIPELEMEIERNIKHAKENGVPLPYTISNLEHIIDDYNRTMYSDLPRTLTGDGIEEARQLLRHLKQLKLYQETTALAKKKLMKTGGMILLRVI